MTGTLIFLAVVAFLCTFIATPYIMAYLRSAGVLGLDLHKSNKPRLPTSGGICVSFGLLAGLLAYIGITTFLYGPRHDLIEMLAVISSIILVTFIGLLDDLGVKKAPVVTKEGKDIRVGIGQWKWLFTLPAAIPLMAIAAGTTEMSVPFVGSVDFGILYPLLIIPIGFVGAANMVNLLGGFNGVEAGMGLVYMSGLALYAYTNGIIISTIIFLAAAASLLAFLRYNFYPAKILPGDSLTYLLGAIVASGIIVGNMEKVGLIMMLPFIVEFFLKARSRLQASSLGILQKDGTVAAPYGKTIYSLSHVVMNHGRFTEKQVAIILITLQVFFSTLPFLGIF